MKLPSTARRDALVVVLGLTTGAVNAVTFLRLGNVFSSVLTGNLVLLDKFQPVCAECFLLQKERSFGGAVIAGHDDDAGIVQAALFEIVDELAEAGIDPMDFLGHARVESGAVGPVLRRGRRNIVVGELMDVLGLCVEEDRSIRVAGSMRTRLRIENGFRLAQG